MTTAPRPVAVVATQLPHTDRRALSQAWYSALHLPQAQARTGVPGPTPAAAWGSASRLDPRGVAVASPRESTAAPVWRAAVGRRDAAPQPGERRSPATDLSRRIERALVRRTSGPLELPAAFTVNAAGGRVRLLVRVEGGATRVVAVCAPQLRERVERALAQARFALTASGTRIEAV